MTQTAHAVPCGRHRCLDKRMPDRPVSDSPATGDLRTRYNAPARGRIDRLVQKFGFAAHTLLVLAVYALVASAIGIALAPALALVSHAANATSGMPAALHWPLLGGAIGASGFVAGFSLLVVVAAYNYALPTRARPFQGGYYCLAAVPWALHNALFYLVRYTFLPYVTLTPFGTLFLRAMGMRIGRRVMLNTELISDPRLIRIDDDAVIGGSVHLFAHYGGGGHLTIAPIHIGARATIGQKCTVMGDVVVGADATILPHSVLLPGSRVPPGDTWGGVPALPIGHDALDAIQRRIAGLAAV
jgi:acetyltransferase-like isoleucine patch superfamily enzyme